MIRQNWQLSKESAALVPPMFSEEPIIIRRYKEAGLERLTTCAAPMQPTCLNPAPIFSLFKS